MSNRGGPDLKNYVDKQISIKLNEKRRVTGTLRGYDPFMNLVLENAVEEVSNTERPPIGTVVIRGTAVLLIEPLESL
jgi:small nuclear ribonucleoprotein G